MAKKTGKKKAKKGSSCGCSGKTLYVIRTPGKVRATRCQGKANKAVADCRKKTSRQGACTWAKVTARTARRRHRRG